MQFYEWPQCLFPSQWLLSLWWVRTPLHQNKEPVWYLNSNSLPSPSFPQYQCIYQTAQAKNQIQAHRFMIRHVIHNTVEAAEITIDLSLSKANIYLSVISNAPKRMAKGEEPPSPQIQTFPLCLFKFSPLPVLLLRMYSPTLSLCLPCGLALLWKTSVSIRCTFLKLLNSSSQCDQTIPGC